MNGATGAFGSSIMRHACFVFILQITASTLYAQVLPSGPPIEQIPCKDLLGEPSNVRSLNDFLLLPPPPTAHSELSSPWSYGSMGLFCKMDVQLARHLPVPLFMRLGDVRHEIDWEHGTGSGWKP